MNLFKEHSLLWILNKELSFQEVNPRMTILRSIIN